MERFNSLIIITRLSKWAERRSGNRKEPSWPYLCLPKRRKELKRRRWLRSMYPTTLNAHSCSLSHELFSLNSYSGTTPRTPSPPHSAVLRRGCENRIIPSHHQTLVTSKDYRGRDQKALVEINQQ